MFGKRRDWACIVVEPLHGDGTTCAVRERKDHRRPGIEIASADAIVERLHGGELHGHGNQERVGD